MAKIALLIGVSEYPPGLSPLPSASQDVLALEKVLIDPEIGEFDQVEVICNPGLEDMQIAIETLFTGRKKDDFLLLYFSGHGIKDENNNLYFTTRNTYKNDVGELRQATAVPARFIHEIMHKSRAKRQAIILDCCFSGAFDPSLKAKDDGSFDIKGQLGSEGRVVLASSGSTQYSFSQKNKELSTYTHHLIEGIRSGKGDYNNDGKVSILELHEYATEKIQEEFPTITPKIIVLKDKGFDIFISKVKTKSQKQDPEGIARRKVNVGGIRLKNTQIDGVLGRYNVIPSLLQTLTPLIERLVERLKSYYLSRREGEKSSNNEIDRDSVLELIRLASDADFIFLMQKPPEASAWQLKAQSHLMSDLDEVSYAAFIRSTVLSTISTETIFTTGHHGIYSFFYDERAGNSKASILIPITTSDDTEFIAVCGLSQDSQCLNDVYTKVVSSFYAATQSANWSPSTVESRILDDLKNDYGFLPISFYERRFELFCEQLSKIVIHFEPILDLRKIAIMGWEALARDPKHLVAPVDLFEAAELWGRRFTVELDIRLLQLATKSYREAIAEAQQNRPNEISPLSVNVYPESLMRTSYFNAVRDITSPDSDGNMLLPADRLVLEISEKAELPKYEDGVRVRSPLKAFRDRLVRYTQELDIRFGIDDFGVGYSSVARLAGLNPPYVKIDRDILHQQQAQVIIRFVREIVSQSSKLYSAKIIVEGLDKQSPISLQQLKQLGVSFVQGYSIGKASNVIYRLTPEKYKELKQTIQGSQR